MPEAYYCEGESGVTYGLEKDGTLFMQIQHPSGEYGDVQISDWSVARWEGQLGAEPCDIAQLPSTLKEMA